MALENLQPQKEFLPQLAPKHVTVATLSKDLDEMEVLEKMKSRAVSPGKSTTTKTKRKS